MELIFFVLYYLTVILCVITLVEVKLTNWNAFQFQDGKAEFEKMQSISELPNYGHCWTKTLISFSKGCKYLSADVQGKLALAYLNCFLSMQELPIYPCNVTQKFSKCTKNMKDADRISMATFFTHAQNICYFLEAHNWHNKTAETIIILQTEIKDLSKIISTYSNNIHKSINESRNKIDAHHNHLLSKIDSNMSAELTSYSNRFYICMLVLAFLMTLTKHTRAAWPWVVVMSTVNLWIESDIKYCPLSLTGDLFLIACRIILVVLSCLALKASACLYQNDRDYLSVILEKAEKLITYELGKAENKMASDTHIASVDRPNTVHDAPGKSIAEPNVEPSTPITDETQKVNDKGNAVVATRLSEGQGLICNCKTGCSDNRCTCKKNERKCNGRCHSSTTCDNK